MKTQLEITEEIVKLKKVAYCVSKLIHPTYMKSPLPQFDDILNRMFILNLDQLRLAIDHLTEQRQGLPNV